MRVVNVSRVDLIKKMTENRTKHEAEYKEALIAWHLDTQDWFKRNHELVTGLTPDKLPSFSVKERIPSKPQSFLDQYDKVLSMLEWSKDDELTLTDTEFDNYVRDTWGWTETFKTQAMSYSNSSNKFQ